MSIPNVTSLSPPMAMPGAAEAVRTADAPVRAASLPSSQPGKVAGARESPPSPTATSDAVRADVKMDDLKQALSEVQSAISLVTNDLQFSLDEDTGKTIVKIVDRETDEVIKQIPSEEILRIAKALDKFQGLLIRQEV